MYYVTSNYLQLTFFVHRLRVSNDGHEKVCRKGPYFYYVDKILAIFDPPSPLVDKHRHLANPL